MYVPCTRPIYVAYGLVSVSFHWNNFLWPLIVTNSVEKRPLTVGLALFGAADWCRLVDYLCGNLDFGGAAACRFSTVSAAIRAVVHSCRN